MKPKSPCKHCKKTLTIQARGLCQTCHADLEIRGCYPSKWEQTRYNGGGREPSAEEVERIVAEQMKCLPSWWDRESVTKEIA